MPVKLFYSWQSDRPNKTGRNLIERALQRTIGSLQTDVDIDEPIRDELEIDRDTKDVAGQPPIVDTIFAKIDAAAIFIPDLTFVGQRVDGRPTPNPNVLIEYGWALKRHGHGRIIAIMNTAYGKPSSETLPFDMQHLRHPIQYDCPDDADDATRATAQAGLAKALARAIPAILAGEEYRASLPAPPVPPHFPRKEELGGPGLFRKPGEALGVVDGRPGFQSGNPDLELQDGPPTWLRLMPAVDSGRRFEWPELRRLASKLEPIYCSVGGFNWVRAEDGFGMFLVTDLGGPTWAVSFAFNTGELWTIDTHAVRHMDAGFIPLFEDGFSASLGRLSSAALELQLNPPFTWIAGIAGVKGRGLSVPPLLHHPSGTCVSDVITREGVHEPGTEPAVSLTPFFTHVYQQCGLIRR